jgi:hypothetical protein
MKTINLKYTLIVGSLLMVGGAQAAPGIQMHGAQFDHYDPTDEACVGRYSYGILNECSNSKYFELGVTKMNNQALNYSIWVDGWQEDDVTTELSFQAYGWNGSFRRQITRVVATDGNWNSNAVFTAAEAQNGHISIVALLPRYRSGQIWGVGIYQ